MGTGTVVRDIELLSSVIEGKDKPMSAFALLCQANELLD